MEEDNLGIRFSHNDVVVVTLNVENYDVCCIFIDNRSSTDIFYYDVFVKIGISLDRLGRVDSPLISFIGDAI